MYLILHAGLHHSKVLVILVFIYYISDIFRHYINGVCKTGKDIKNFRDCVRYVMLTLNFKGKFIKFHFELTLFLYYRM